MKESETKLQTDIDNKLHSKLLEIDEEQDFLDFVFDYCESQEDREKILTYINAGHDDRIEVLLMASQISIENGNSEGELEEE